jgi:glycosyltransferase involved in cell wall biosynthesis
MLNSVSVIIPTYNYGRFIADAIESVLRQTLPPAEILVVDDGSTDDTREIIKSFGDEVRYLYQSNAGVCAARNRGAAESRGDLICFIDADDTMVPESIEKQVAKFAEDGVGLVHCGLRLVDHETSETIELQLEGGEDGVADNLLLWEGPVIAGPGAIIVSREAFFAVGGFDTEMKVGEDWDFCYRVARKFKVRFVAEPLVIYRQHASAAHRNVAEMERGMAKFYEKAFTTSDESVLNLRSRAYGNFHKVLAGSYFHAGDYGNFARHAAMSILRRPKNFGYFLSFPARRLFTPKQVDSQNQSSND